MIHRAYICQPQQQQQRLGCLNSRDLSGSRQRHRYQLRSQPHLLSQPQQQRRGLRCLLHPLLQAQVQLLNRMSSAIRRWLHWMLLRLTHYHHHNQAQQLTHTKAVNRPCPWYLTHLLSHPLCHSLNNRFPMCNLHLFTSSHNKLNQRLPAALFSLNLNQT